MESLVTRAGDQVGGDDDPTRCGQDDAVLLPPPLGGPDYRPEHPGHGGVAAVMT